MEQRMQQPELNVLGKLVAGAASYGHNVTNNLSNAFANTTLQSWLRLTVIICGYMLLRPYIMKLSAKFAVKKLEQEDAQSQKDQKAAAAMTPNEFRGIKEKLNEMPDEGDGSGADWGGNARLRQRQMLKDLLEEEERRRAAENEDADIQEFLED